MTAPPLILASASSARKEMLIRAGLSFTIDAAGVDEQAIKAACRARGESCRAAALALAAAKALNVSQRCPDALVIGADQMLDCDGRWFDKPVDQADARAALTALAGRTHMLISAAACARGGRLTWSEAAAAQLTMRMFSQGFLDTYLGTMGDSVRQTVGAYRLEGLGVQLFSRIEGDYFTILGLPLLALLAYLRQAHVLMR